MAVDTAQAYALDRPSDDEDDDEEDMDLSDMNAIGNQAGQGNAPGVITSDFFQRAMMMAGGGSNLNPPAPVVNQVWMQFIYV